MNEQLRSIRTTLVRLLKKWRPPRRVFPTKAGWAAFAAPFVLGMAAINAGNNLLFLLLGACLGAIVISGIMSERALAGLRVELRSIGRVRAGEHTRFGLLISRELFEPGDNPSFGLVVKEQRTWLQKTDAKESLSAVFPRIQGAKGQVMASRVFKHRGRARMRPLEISTIYPFGLLTKSKDLPLSPALIVWPRPVPVPQILERPGGYSPRQGQEQDRGLGVEIYGLRERTEYDAQNRIHARRSLALGRDVVVETERQNSPQAWIGVVNNKGIDREVFERILELAVQTMLRWSDQGYRVGLWIGRQAFEPDTYSLESLIDKLALLEQSQNDEVSSNLSPRALWLLPQGFLGLSENHQCCYVDKNGEVSPG